MVIRKVEGPQTVHAFEGTRKENDVTRCPINELPSDPVCQLHKVRRILSEGCQSLMMADSLYPPDRVRIVCTSRGSSITGVRFGFALAWQLAFLRSGGDFFPTGDFR